MISAKILADSINPAGVRLTSWLLTYPRFIHSEFMTHRVFSRNAASSRAIPLNRMMDAVLDNPALPAYWAAEHKGMAAIAALDPDSEGECFAVWQNANLRAVEFAGQASKYGLAKSLCNRLLEPFAHMTVIATATDHRNFFGLRAHPAAMPEFQVLAYMMLREYRMSVPHPVAWGEWHIPDFTGSRKDGHILGGLDGTPMDQKTRLMVAVARCARLSYLTFDGEHSIEKDLELFERLKGPPMHASPFEHVAQAVEDPNYPHSNFDDFHIQFKGEQFRFWGLSYWKQFRKTFENENGLNANLDEIAATEPEWVRKYIEAQ